MGAAFTAARYSFSEILVIAGFLALGLTVTAMVKAMRHFNADLQRRNPLQAAPGSKGLAFLKVRRLQHFSIRSQKIAGGKNAANLFTLAHHGQTVDAVFD